MKRENTEQRYSRLNRRIVRRLPVTAAETAFVWREKSRRINQRAEAADLARLTNYFEIGQDPDSPDAEEYGRAVSSALRDGERSR